MEEIGQKLIQLIREIGEFPPEYIIDQATKLSELGVNSVSFMKVIVWAEESFGIEFDDDNLDYKKFGCVGDLITVIEQQCINTNTD